MDALQEKRIERKRRKFRGEYTLCLAKSNTQENIQLGNTR